MYLYNLAGNLYFTHITAEDGQNGAKYRCNVYNLVTDMTVHGEHNIIEPQGRNSYCSNSSCVEPLNTTYMHRDP